MRAIALLAVVCSANAFSAVPMQSPLLRSGRTASSAVKMTLRSDSNKAVLVAAIAATTIFGVPAFDASASVITQVMLRA